MHSYFEIEKIKKKLILIIVCKYKKKLNIYITMIYEIFKLSSYDRWYIFTS